MVKQNKNQMEANKNQTEIAKEISPNADTEYASEYPYHAPEKGMDKKQQQQPKQK